MGAMLSSSTAEAGGGLRRKRNSESSSSQYKSSRQSPLSEQQQQYADGTRRLSEESAATGADTTATTGDDLARKFFLPPSHKELEDIDMRQLILEMNLDTSMSIMTPEPTPPPTNRPTVSPTMSTNAPSQSSAPTLTNCDNPGTCENRLRDQLYAVSVRVGTTELLDDPLSPQSLAADWILEECDATIPIDPCTESQIILNEQRYALAVMYFSLSGDGWNNGANPGADKGAGAGVWLSGLNYCDWGVEISSETGGSYNQLVCDDFGNVLNLNLRECFIIICLTPLLRWLVFEITKTNYSNSISPFMTPRRIKQHDWTNST